MSESNIAELGYTTLSAKNGTEALALLKEDGPIDVLFTDINMPDGPSGIELAQQAVELHPGLRVIYTSGASVTDGTRALFVEGARFLPKPYRREQLFEVILDNKKR